MGGSEFLAPPTPCLLHRDIMFMATAPSSSSPPTALYPVTSPPSHFLLGSLHLLGWLVLQPSAWREYCARIDPPLAPCFAFVDLTPHQWAQPTLRRVLLQGFGILPLLIGVLLGGAGCHMGTGCL